MYIINLDGNGSTDLENNIIRYAWTRISGPPSFNIAKATAVQTQVTNLVQGVYKFELNVMDSGGLPSKDTMLVYVINKLKGHEIIYRGGWSCNDLCRDVDVYWDSSPWDDHLYSDPILLYRYLFV